MLRGYARLRSELRHGALAYATQQRIALAVAEHQQSEYALSTLQRTARDAGLGLDEIALAREFDSRDEKVSVLMRYVKSLVETDGSPPRHLLEETREAGWEDEEILEAIAHVALATFGNLVTRAGEVPERRFERRRPAAPGAGLGRGETRMCAWPRSGSWSSSETLAAGTITTPWSWWAGAGRAPSSSS